MSKFEVEISHLLRVSTKMVVEAPSQLDAQAALHSLYRAPELEFYCNSHSEIDDDFEEEGIHRVVGPAPEDAVPQAIVRPLESNGRVITFPEEKK